MTTRRRQPSSDGDLPTAAGRVSDQEAPTTIDPRTTEEGIQRDAEVDRESAEETEEDFPSGSQVPEDSDEWTERRDGIRECLNLHYDRLESTSTRSPWGIMHTLIAFGVDTEVLADNRRVNAIGWLCYNGSCRGQRLFYTSNGNLRLQVGPGVQGHHGQFLAMLAQSKVSRDYPIRADGREFTVSDLVALEQRTCRPGTELTFKLIGLAHYLPSDATWTSDQGEEWDIPRLISEELKQPVLGAACGGTHRMMGFAYAVRRREMRNEPIDGQWARAKTYVEDFQEYTFKLQNPDGSFSCSWFEGRSDWNDPARKLQTTGHILEWLVYSLPEERLRDPELVEAVDFLTNLMLERPDRQWEIGPRGHALHALALYDQRVFGARPGERSRRVAQDIDVAD